MRLGLLRDKVKINANTTTKAHQYEENIIEKSNIVIARVTAVIVIYQRR